MGGEKGNTVVNSHRDHVEERIKLIMEWTEASIHLSADRILLGSSPIPKDLRSDVVRQLSYRSKMWAKYPTLFAQGLYLPAGIAYEQSSGEATARYKKHYVREKEVLVDGTGGLGIDFSMMAQAAQKAVYIEREEQFVTAARYNVPRLLLSEKNVDLTIEQADMCHSLKSIVDRGTTLLYFDPARRSEGGQRTYALEDTVPNPVTMVDELKQLGYEGRLLVKLSPMIDITDTLRQLPMLTHIEIIVHQGEVKELLGYVEDLNQRKGEDEIPIRVTSLADLGEVAHSFAGSLKEERTYSSLTASGVGEYLYVPHAGAFKSGLYKTLAHRWQVKELHVNSHLYTADKVCTEFPGKCYKVVEVLPFHASMLKRLHKSIPEANFSARNFPLKPELFYAKSHIKQGDAVRLFGTTLGNGDAVILRLQSVDPFVDLQNPPLNES